MASGLGTFEKVLRAGEGRRLKRIAEQAEYVLSLQPDFEKLSDDELRGKSVEFKQRIENGESLEELLFEAYAAIREAFRRDRLVELFGMKDFIRELTEAYSHGMKQRLVLAATLLHKPKVILVDEPLVGLDPHTARLVKQVFRDQARGGTSIFMSTHVLSVAEDFADRIGIMSQGKLVALGKLDDLRRQAQLEGRLEDVFFKITEGAANPYE
jgi:ABC-type multidrug transport system ATPase subunit